MAIDHAGFVLFPEYIVFRLIGRLSMPIFAYCIARGVYYSNNKGTFKRYIINMLIFAVLSQIPYYFFNGPYHLNIGFTWLLSMILLYIIIKKKRRHILPACVIIGVISVLMPVEYSFLGSFLPVIFYWSAVKKNNFSYAFIGVTIITTGYIILNNNGAVIIQFLSILAVPLIAILQRYDSKIKLPKWFFYVFYPAHILLLMVIKQLFS